MKTHYYFVEALDVLKLRGNQDFGAAGQHGQAMLPPWPSVFAGAFRSALLADDAGRLADFVRIASAQVSDENVRSRQMRERLGAELFATLGTPQQPGSFRIHWATLATARGQAVQQLHPLPADLTALQHGGGDLEFIALQPSAALQRAGGPGHLPMTAVLRTARQVKPVDGCWLDDEGFAAHLQGRLPAIPVRSDALYKREVRLGIALDAASRTASEGALYTSEAVSMLQNTGFLVGIEGANMLADTGLLRLGGDGHAARWRRVAFTPPAVPAIEPGGRFRLLLCTPGIFSGGWLPAGVARDTDGGCRLLGNAFSARLACAAIPRHAVISGWDLARWAPKTAQRVVPAGSVYWFDQFEGDAGKLADWVAAGVWPDNATMPSEFAQRRAEGFNNALIGRWP